jgi:phosphoglycolate phosphatase
MDKKVIIFDFDGTVADTVQEGIRLFNEIAPRYGFKLITPENIPALRSRRTREGLKELNVSMYRLAFIVGKMRNGIRAGVAKAKTYPDVKSVIMELKQRGYHLIMASSNTVENIKSFLKNNGMEDCFETLHSGSGVFGKAKQLNKIINKEGYDKTDVYYVGDEARDVDAAKTAGIKIVAVTWGLNDRLVLSALGSDFVIDKPEELLEIFP